MLKKFLLLLLVVFVIMQFIQVDVNIPENYAPPKIDFLVKYKAPEDVKTLLKDGCFDCHSYETEYKWYMSIAPISWFTKEHVKDGRNHLNFSDWDSYDLDKKKHKLEECYEEIEENEMPLSSYINMHNEADFSSEERKKIIAWFKELEKAIVN